MVDMKIEEIGIVLKPSVVNEFTTMLPNLFDWLKRKKISVYFSEKDQDRISKILKSKREANFIKKADMLNKMDLIITLGGDGTLIGMARKSNQNSCPIFGINMGNLGFITEFSKQDFYDDLENFLKGKYESRKISLFKAEVFENDKKLSEHYFINDAVVTKSGISRMFSISLETEKELIYDLAGDGLIVSSPIGSTAYSLAAGGPIVHPSTKAFILTPICPHSLTHRPIILPDNETVTIHLGNREEQLSLTLDGQEDVTVLKNHQVKISKSTKKYVNLVINPNREYFDTLKEKFKHGRR